MDCTMLRDFTPSKRRAPRKFRFGTSPMPRLTGLDSLLSRPGMEHAQVQRNASRSGMPGLWAIVTLARPDGSTAFYAFQEEAIAKMDVARAERKAKSESRPAKCPIVVEHAPSAPVAPAPAAGQRIELDGAVITTTLRPFPVAPAPSPAPNVVAPAIPREQQIAARMAEIQAELAKIEAAKLASKSAPRPTPQIAPLAGCSPLGVRPSAPADTIPPRPSRTADPRRGAAYLARITAEINARKIEAARRAHAAAIAELRAYDEARARAIRVSAARAQTIVVSAALH